jgi:N-acyl-D-aspartate/D-glutamate deacylase
MSATHETVIRGGTIVDGTGTLAYSGDLAIEGGRITQVGGTAGKGAREIDAHGLVVAPGWVDVHTHYDGQATWDPEMTPSSWHGVTTVVMGNCGVGFAPVKAESRDFLIELMEAIEDIPGTALHEGISWDWESFPEYLSVLDSQPRVLDVAAQLPHAALRTFVMGERAHEDSTDAEVAEMARLVEEALNAGAAGFSTSRFVGHRSKYGLMPGTFAPRNELFAIADAFARSGRGVIQVIADGLMAEGIAQSDDRQLIVELAQRAGRPVTYSLAQAGSTHGYREALADAEHLNAQGLRIVPQVGTRPFGFLFGLHSTIHPFVWTKQFQPILQLPLEEQVRRLKDPNFQEILFAEPVTEDVVGRMVRQWDHIYRIDAVPDYEPSPDQTVAAVAAREGRDPQDVALEWMLERDGKSFLMVIMGGYRQRNLDAVREMLAHPLCIAAASDAGAHVGIVADASSPTSLLTFWARDRHRGEKLPLEHVVAIQTGRTAATYGLSDRGTLAVGKRADINLIDLDNLTLHGPEMLHDLPAGGRRLVQRVDGYRATFVAGQQTFDNGVATGIRPGRLVRT